MPRISIDNYDTVASWNGSQDLFIVEQPDGTKVATPAMVKQYVLAGVTETSEQYAECSTARNVAAKTVTLPGFKLEAGARISVRFTNTGTSNPASGHITLNVNGTGAKEIVDGHANMTILSNTSGGLFYNNLVDDFVYDGTYWVYMNRDNNTTYSSKTAASGGTATSLCTTGEKYTWNNKQNALTFDNVPTRNSNNPVKSGGIFSTIANKIKKLPTQTTKYKFTAANTYQYTGVNVTCPAGHTYIVRVFLVYNNSEPKGIVASSRSDTMRMYECYAREELAASITFVLMEGESAYIWGKGTTTNGDDVSLDIVDITN